MRCHALRGMRPVRLPRDDPFIAAEVARLHPSHLDASRTDPRRFARRQPVVVENRDTGARVVRHAMGAGRGQSICRDQVGLDYEALDQLGRLTGERPVAVRPATYREQLRHYLRHPDSHVRLSMQLALLSVVLGVLGFFSGVASLAAAVL